MQVKDLLIVRTVYLPLLKKFGLEQVELQILKRGAFPKGGGAVLFKCGPIKALTPIQCIDQGQVRRIRGIAYCTR